MCDLCYRKEENLLLHCCSHRLHMEPTAEHNRFLSSTVGRHQSSIACHVSHHPDTVQFSDWILTSERTERKPESQTKTRSLLKSQRFSTVEGCSWNFNLFHLRLRCRMTHTHTHTHTHTCIPVLCPELTQVHALFMHMQTNFLLPPFFIPVTSCSSVLFHLWLSSCLPPLVSVCVCLSRYFFNQVELCLGYSPAFLTSVCLLPFSSLPPLFLPSPLRSSNQCFAVRAASLSPSLASQASSHHPRFFNIVSPSSSSFSLPLTQQSN